MPFLDTSVKWMHEGFRGAPVLNGTVGSRLACLRAFLITGYGATVANSVTVAGGIATATLTVANGFELFSVISIDGASDAALNGEARVSLVSGMQVSWPTTASDGVKSGTITLKYAPVGGWEELFAGTVLNVGVFRSAALLGTRMCLRVDDTAATSSRVVGYEAMTDANTGASPFPTTAQNSGGGYWVKSSVANAAAVPYVMVGDSRFFHVCTAWYVPTTPTARTFVMLGFGDLVSPDPVGDAFACALALAGGAAAGTPALIGSFGYSAAAASGISMCRAKSGVVGAVPSQSAILGANNVNIISGADINCGALADSPGGRLLLVPRIVRDGIVAEGAVRGFVPGQHHSPQTGVLAAIPERSTVSVGGRRLLSVGASNNGVSAPAGAHFLDITGPWR